jgi:hypothetical protein
VITIGKGRVKLRLIDGRIRTLPGVLHIPGIARNLIYVSKMEDAGVRTILWRKGYVVASKTRAYRREGSSTTTR